MLFSDPVVAGSSPSSSPSSVDSPSGSELLEPLGVEVEGSLTMRSWQAVMARAIRAKSRTRTRRMAVSRGFQQEGSGPDGRELKLTCT
jgi:hypothetical protein